MNVKITSVAALAIAGVLTSANAQDQCDTILNTGSIDVTQGGVSCADAGITTNNFFAKSYDLSGATEDFYVNCIRDSDRHLGTVLRALEQNGLAEDTVVVLTSDHGELAGERLDASNQALSSPALPRLLGRLEAHCQVPLLALACGLHFDTSRHHQLTLRHPRHRLA